MAEIQKCQACSAPLEPGPAGARCPYCGCRQASPEGAPAGSGDERAQRGMAAYARGEYAVAVRELETALALGLSAMRRADVSVRLGDAYDDVGNFEKAEEVYRGLLKENPRDARALTGLGITSRHRGDPEGAIRFYEQALAADPKCAAALTSLGYLLLLRGEAERAVAMMERAAALDPSIANTHANLALAHATLGNFGAARAALKVAALRGYGDVEGLKGRIEALEDL